MENIEANHKNQVFFSGFPIICHFSEFYNCSIYFRTEDKLYQSNMHNHGKRKQITPEAHQDELYHVLPSPCAYIYYIVFHSRKGQLPLPASLRVPESTVCHTTKGNPCKCM